MYPDLPEGENKAELLPRFDPCEPLSTLARRLFPLDHVYVPKLNGP